LPERVTIDSTRSSPRHATSLLDVNRQLYDPLWTDARLIMRLQKKLALVPGCWMPSISMRCCSYVASLAPSIESPPALLNCSSVAWFGIALAFRLQSWWRGRPRGATKRKPAR
jgi:hypothetical protein